MIYQEGNANHSLKYRIVLFPSIYMKPVHYAAVQLNQKKKKKQKANMADGSR